VRNSGFFRLWNGNVSARLMPLLFTAVWLSGCASQVSITSAWQDNAPRNQTFKKVLVVGVSPDINQRCTFEDFMASQIRSESTMAIASCDVVTQKDPLTRESIDLAIASQQADAVLATVLVSKTFGVKEGGGMDTRGSAMYKATDFGFASGYYGNYGTYGIPVVYGEFQASPAITTLESEAHITSTLYETRGATLLYTLDTKAQKLESRGSSILAITAPIADRLRKEKLVR
jgi:hypothetical protein